VYAFCNRRRNRVKLLLYDRSGFVMVLNDLGSYYSPFSLS
jgi:transposase